MAHSHLRHGRSCSKAQRVCAPHPFPDFADPSLCGLDAHHRSQYLAADKTQVQRQIRGCQKADEGGRGIGRKGHFALADFPIPKPESEPKPMSEPLSGEDSTEFQIELRSAVRETRGGHSEGGSGRGQSAVLRIDNKGGARTLPLPKRTVILQQVHQHHRPRPHQRILVNLRRLIVSKHTYC